MQNTISALYRKWRTTCQTALNLFGAAWFIFALGFYTSCGRKNDPRRDDTPTTGMVNIAADEAYRIILEDQRFLFEIKYPKSKLNMIYTGEDQALDMLVSDTVRMAIVSCRPGPRELNFFKQKGITHHVNHIAYDAIVLVVNKECPLDSLNHNQVKQLITGQLTDWQALKKNDKVYGSIVLGFNMQGSGILNYFRRQYLGQGQKFPANSGVFKNTMNLLDSVAKHPNIIGFIPYNYISDKDDSLARAIKANFKIISLQATGYPNQFVLPSQSSIADSTYPFIRPVYVINREGKTGLGTGFVIFMNSHKGQRVMLKAGMVPAIMPGREVRIKQK